MSNEPFDRTIIRPLEKPLSQDVNQLATNFDQMLRFYIAALHSDKSTGTPFDGFMGRGLIVAATSPTAMSVVVNAGLGFQRQTGTEIAIDNVIGVNDLELYKPIPLMANQNFTVPTAPVAPNSRIDIIEVKADRVVTDPSTRKVLDEGLGSFVPDSVNKTLAWALDNRAQVVNSPANSTAPLSYKVGVAAVSPTAPSVTDGYIQIAAISVGSDVVSIVDADITDSRLLITDKTFQLTFPATNGFSDTSPTASTFGSGGRVLVNPAEVLNINIDGIETGDIIENIEVFWEKVNSTNNDITSFVLRGEAIVGSPYGLVPYSGETSSGITTQQVYLHDHAAANPGSGLYPFTWTKGMGATVEFNGNFGVAVEAAISVVVTVRRPIMQRNP